MGWDLLLQLMELLVGLGQLILQLAVVLHIEKLGAFLAHFVLRVFTPLEEPLAVPLVIPLVLVLLLAALAAHH